MLWPLMTMNNSDYYDCFSRIAVLGSGTMGRQIAAHCANAGLDTLLFGIEKKATHQDSAAYAIAQLKNMKPPALAHPKRTLYLRACTYDDDLPRLKQCDWVIEAVSEELEVKRSLYERITPHLNPECILSSNTSGIRLAHLAQQLSTDMQQRFLGSHFFNPPRYMSLVELIPTAKSSTAGVDKLEGFLTSRLGKNIVLAKDTAGFIANRFGLFAMASTLHHAETFNLPCDVVDELTGSLLHRPKSATFRTMDLVGIDVILKVSEHLYESLHDDPWRQVFKLPHWLQQLQQQGRLGEKTKCGVYRKNLNGEIEVYRVKDDEYTNRQKALSAAVKKLMQQAPAQRWLALAQAQAQEPQAAFLYSVYRDLFHYAAYHAAEVAHDVCDIDCAMRWGYGWQEGIFDLWQAMGWQQVRQNIENDRQANKTLAAAALPDWCCDSSRVSVYQDGQVWSPEQDDAVAPHTHPIHSRQLHARRRMAGRHDEIGHTLFDSQSLRLWCEEDNIGIVSLKTKMHSLNYAAIKDLAQVIQTAEQQCQGLLIWSPQAPFCVGANLLELLIAARIGKIKANTLGSKIKAFSMQFTHSQLPDISDVPPVATVLEELQNVFMRLRYCRIPTVAVVHGLALGGGCEMLLHCDHAVAALESYIGLVEAGVGLIPAGGGCTAMARRAYQQTPDNGDLFPRLSGYYRNIALGRVASSAYEAQAMGYLRPQDTIVMHSNELLAAAKKQVEAMQAAGYHPPSPRQRFAVAGSAAAANCKTELANMHRGAYISDYDVDIAAELAEVLCGSGLHANTLVNERWLLRREQQAFLRLLARKPSQERIEHMLKKNKPLRN